jgi:5-methylcytosine-specific restriction enzyme A
LIQGAIIDSALGEASVLLGLNLVRTSARSQDFDFEVRIASLPEPKGMYLRVADDYLAWTCQLKMDDLSRRLVQYLGKRSQISAVFSDLLEEIKSKFSDFDLKLEQSGDLDLSMQNWETFELSFSVPFEKSGQKDALVELLIWAFSIPISLIFESDEKPEDLLASTGEIEGTLSKQTYTHYERSRKNRAICLLHHGFTCAACGEEMSAKYGLLGAEVIHVHHILPVSQMEKPDRIDPIKDLLPLCPNCHNVVHQKNPPVPVSELREHLKTVVQGNKTK